MTTDAAPPDPCAAGHFDTFAVRSSGVEIHKCKRCLGYWMVLPKESSPPAIVCPTCKIRCYMTGICPLCRQDSRDLVDLCHCGVDLRDLWCPIHGYEVQA